MRICSKCKQEKELSEFHKDKHNRSGLKGWCKVCCRVHLLSRKEWRKDWREKNKKKHSSKG